MLKQYQSIYVASYRWLFKNFGQGKLPQMKSLFNISFLLIVALTASLLCAEFILHTNKTVLGFGFSSTMVLVTLFFLILSHLILLNNKWLKQLNTSIASVSHHHKNKWSVVVLLNAVVICLIVVFTTV